MTSTRRKLAIGLASATFAVCVINAVGNVAVLLKAGPTPVLSIAAMVLAAATFVIAWNQRSLFVAGLLTVSGIVFMLPALGAMGYSFAFIVFPGPILGVIFGLVIFGLGLAMVARSVRAKELTASR